ncbi:Regulator of rDNA transcription protein [Dirofilaria immitis]
MIGRADIEGSKSNVAMGAWLHKPVIPVVTFLTPLARNLLINSKGSIGHAFAVCIRTGNQDQASFCPFTLREVSVLSELALGHLRYILTDVPPQSNSRLTLSSVQVIKLPKHWAEIRDSQRPQGPSVSSVLIRQSDSPTRPAQSLEPILIRSYGSNLPTSLTYIILSTRGCSPWRPAADMAHETPQEPWRFTETTSLSPAEPIPGSPFLNQKENSGSGFI